MALLEAEGYRCSRSAASLGLFDIIAVGPADVLLVQVKSNRLAGNEETARLRTFRCPPNAKNLLHVWKDRARQPLVKEIT